METTNNKKSPTTEGKGLIDKNESTNNNSYLQQRFSELKITPEQNEISVFDSIEGHYYKSEFFKSDKHDNIIINYFSPTGYVEKCEVKGKSKNFYRTRLKEPNGHGKYSQPTGSETKPFMTPIIIEKVKNKISIETLVIVEGEFKSFSASINEIDAIGIGGINHFKNKGENKLHEYFYTIIETCQVKNIVLLFDADVFALKYKPGSDLYLWRNSFYCAVKNFKELTKTLNVDVYFSHIKTSLNETTKGLDDLINHVDTDVNILKSELNNLTVGNEARQYIDCIGISANSISKLREYFALDNVHEFYKKYAEFIGNNDFIFNKKTYEIIEGNPIYKMSCDLIFWYVFLKGKEQVPTLDVNELLYANWLQSVGFARIYLGKIPMAIRVDNNIVDEVTDCLIRDFVNDFVRSLPDVINNEYEKTKEKVFYKTDLERLLIKRSKDLFSPMITNHLKSITLKTKRDTKDEAFLYFTNWWLKITKDSFETFDYSELKSPIWRKQIIKREFHFVEANNCEIQQLIFNACEKNTDRYNTVISALGYLSHSYKDPANTKAIIFADEKIGDSNEANGGSGKSLVARSWREIKNVWYQGKDFNPKATFAWEGVGLDTDIILLDDASMKFPFESLFTKVTGDFEIEGKNDKKFTIPFSASSKIAITTNFTIQGEGTSHDRRKSTYEFSDHYNGTHTPLIEFGHRLFDDWDDNQWQQFHLFMINAVIYYLENGLQQVKVNYDERSLLQKVGQSFVDFMDNNIEKNTEYLTNNLLEKLKEFDKDFKEMKSNSFNGNLKKYVKCRNLKTVGSEIPKNKEAPLTKVKGKIYIQFI